MADEWTDVAAQDEIKPGRCKRVDVDDEIIAVYNVDGELYAIEDRCTHDGGELASGEIEGCQVICPRHGARFNIKTGQALTAPAYEDVHTFPVRVDNGVVQVRDDRWD